MSWKYCVHCLGAMFGSSVEVRTGAGLIILSTLMWPATAPAGQISSCPNGPTITCVVDGSQACGTSSGWYQCIFYNSTDDIINAVTDDDETWVWGNADGDDFCCHTGSVVGILPVKISTDDGDDEVYLGYGDYDLLARSQIRTQDGDDWPLTDCEYQSTNSCPAAPY